jgi:hypothetical protein
MSLKSKAQQGFLFAKKPKVAKEMADKTTKKEFKNLPPWLKNKEVKVEKKTTKKSPKSKGGK